MAIFKSIKPGPSLKNIIDYVSKEFNKTEDTHNIRGINVADNPEIAKIQMFTTKKEFNKETGRQYQHYVLSFGVNDNITPHEAMNYAERHAKECFGDRFEVFLAVHQDSAGEKLHVHYVVNSVSFIDGKKIQTSNQDYDNFKNINDQIAKEHGLKIIDRDPVAVKERGRAQLYDQREYQSYIRGKSEILTGCSASVLKVLERKPENFECFKDEMKKMGWETQLRGKNIVFKNCDTQQRIRANTLARKINNDKLSTAQILKNCNELEWQKYQNNVTKNNLNNNGPNNHFSLTLPQVNCAEDQKTPVGFKVNLREDYERD